MNKTKTVVLLENDRDSMVDNWTDSLTVSRNGRKRFTVKLSKFGDGPDGNNRGWRIWDKTADLSTPTQVLDAIESITDEQGLSLDWAEATTLIAELDWITAAIIAVKKKVALPKVPTLFDLVEQRSLTTLGKVEIGVEWGYDMHELSLDFVDWLCILQGDSYGKESSYYYEGKRFVATWSFDITGDCELEITYGDDGGTGWRGALSSVDVLQGKSIDGFDLAQLLIKAPRAAEF